MKMILSNRVCARQGGSVAWRNQMGWVLHGAQRHND